MRKILILLGAVAVFVAGCGGGGSSTPVKLTGNTTNKGTKDLAGTSIELHVHPGCPHGFDRLGDIPVVRRAFADRHRVLRAF